MPETAVTDPLQPIRWKMNQMLDRVKRARQSGHYFYLQPIQEFKGARVKVKGRGEMIMFASYCYLDLLGHPYIDAAAQAAIRQYSSGTHGVRILAGTLPLHNQLEHKIAAFKGAEEAIVFSSGYVTNLSVVSTLCGRNDVVVSDKLNHASIVDGCLLSRAQFVRFRHNDMESLERVLFKAGGDTFKLVVADAVFSMDGDIINLPEVVRLCRKYGALLMIDEAHSLGVLGETGHGIEEHFGLQDGVDIHMGTLSKTIPSVGGYVAGKQGLIEFLKHTARAFVFSAALPPAQTAAAKASFEVIEQEPERIHCLRRNIDVFIGGLHERGFDTLNSETAIIPVICGRDEQAMEMARRCQDQGLFVLPIVPPAVPEGSSRLRVNVTAGHTLADLDYALGVLGTAGKELGVI